MRYRSLTISLCFSLILPGCYLVDHFRQDRGEDESNENYDGSNEVLGESLGAKAGARNQAALDGVWATSTSHPPAAVRPDPDLLARQMLKQFKPEGTTLARVTGDVENYRQLLGGAPADFITFPTDGYDATSLLAKIKVAEELCTALVAPSTWRHSGWTSILPYGLNETQQNVTWLLQRMTGLPTSQLSSDGISRLVTILNNNNTDQRMTNEDYIAPCMAVMIDAENLFL